MVDQSTFREGAEKHLWEKTWTFAAAGRRIRLSKKAVAEQRERAELRDYAARPDTAPAASIGSLADKLRGALRGRD